MNVGSSSLSLLWTRLVKGGSETLLVTSPFSWPSHASCSLRSLPWIKLVKGGSETIPILSSSLMPSLKRSFDFLSGCRSNELIISCWLQWMQLSFTGRRRQWSQHRRYSQGLQKEKTRGLISQRQKTCEDIECETQHEICVQWLKREAHIKLASELQT